MVAHLFRPVLAPAAASAERTARSLRSRREADHDAGLVQRFNTGDQTAFAEIVSRYRTRMHQVALNLLKNHADAEEIAQDTFIRAHRGLARFRGESSLAAWLHRITLNLSRNRYWYFHRRRRHLANSLDSSIGEDSQTTYANLLASPAPGPVQETTNREFTALVTTCMERLNAGQREILILRNSQQLSYQEIARRLDIDIGTVKSRIGRARERLRSLLTEAYAGSHPREASRTGLWFEPARPAGLLGIVPH